MARWTKAQGRPKACLDNPAIAETLAKTKGNREKAAKILGIGERTLYRKIRQHDL
jgi:two-component system response regulator HydG